MAITLCTSEITNMPYFPNYPGIDCDDHCFVSFEISCMQNVEWYDIVFIILFDFLKM